MELKSNMFLPKPDQPPIDISHLNLFRNYLHGPIQRDEALFLYSLVLLTRPKCIIEFGYQFGLSALNFSVAMDLNCHLYSFDINPCDLKIINHPNFHFLLKGQETFSPKDIDNRQIDICLLDGAHKVNLNIVCLEKVIPRLSPNGLLILHDTGLYTPEGIKNAPLFYRKNLKHHRSTPAVQEERITANIIIKRWSDLKFIHLHATSIMRNGFTLFQKSGKLSNRITHV